MHDTRKISENKQTLTERILYATMQEFAAKGIRAVKMDDIATKLQMSKRTLYELFANKEEMLIEGVKLYTSKRMEQIRQYADSGVSVMDILLRSLQMKMEEVKLTNPLFYAELEKYPALLAYFDDRHEEHRAMFISFLERGVAEGFFLKGLNYDFVAQMIDASNQLVMQTQMYKKFSMETVFMNHVFLSIRGLCTQKGIDEIDRFMAKYDSTKTM